MFPPTVSVLQGLFRDPSMFDSHRDWRKAGFEVEGKGVESDIMVASHPSAQGCLFKKYSKKVSLKEQLKNYRRRVEGAQKLREFIAEQQLVRIVVPQKYLHELPPEFSRKGVSSYMLVVERIALLSTAASKQQYLTMDNETLEQLCTVLLMFQYLDSGIRNIPVTDHGQIAFVDTERWDPHETKKIPLRHLREYLSDDQRQFVDALHQTPAPSPPPPVTPPKLTPPTSHPHLTPPAAPKFK